MVEDVTHNGHVVGQVWQARSSRGLQWFASNDGGMSGQMFNLRAEAETWLIQNRTVPS